MKRVRQQRAVFQALLSPSPAEIIARFGSTLAELTPQRLFAAAVARAEVDELVDVAPFPELKLTELCSRIFDESGPVPKLRASAGKRALATLQGKLALEGAELETMIQRVLMTFVRDFGAAWVKDGRVAKEKIVALPITGQLLT